MLNLLKKGSNSKETVYKNFTKYLGHSLETIWIQLWLNEEDKDKYIYEFPAWAKHEEIYGIIFSWIRDIQFLIIWLLVKRDSDSFWKFLSRSLLFLHKIKRKMVFFQRWICLIDQYKAAIRVRFRRIGQKFLIWLQILKK